MGRQVRQSFLGSDRTYGARRSSINQCAGLLQPPIAQSLQEGCLLSKVAQLGDPGSAGQAIDGSARSYLPPTEGAPTSSVG